MMTSLTTEAGHQQPVISSFGSALTREILLTEQLRVKTVIATVSLLMVLLTLLHLLVPGSMERIWRGHFEISQFYAISFPLLVFELSVLWLVKKRIALNRDLPYLRRYLGALIETSLPTMALAVQMNAMGAERALGYAAPLAYFIFIILSTLRLDFWLSAFTGLVAAVELFAMAMLYHPAGYEAEAAREPGYNIIRSILLLIGGVLAGAVGMQLRRQFEASIAAATSRDRVTNLFGQHVSPQVVERLLASGADIANETRNVAVMFVDFRSFTAAAQVRPPQEVVARLDGAFAVLVEILDHHSGIVNKFLGDGFMALFGAPIEDPQAADRAVAAARDMLTAMRQNNAENDWQLRIGIGVHMGAVVAGNIGSPRRKEYTVIGDTVNFASRLESLNKDFNSQLLISAAVRDALGDGCSDATSLGEVPIRGYDQPQTIWRLA
jgi:adenylate cyclase